MHTRKLGVTGMLTNFHHRQTIQNTSAFQPVSLACREYGSDSSAANMTPNSHPLMTLSVVHTCPFGPMPSPNAACSQHSSNTHNIRTTSVSSNESDFYNLQGTRYCSLSSVTYMNTSITTITL